MKVIALAIREGLQMIAEEIRNNRENRELDKLEGRITDEEKLRMLKYDLYKHSRCSFITENDVKHLEQLRKTISLISNEVECKNDRDYSLITIVNEACRVVITLGGLAIGFSLMTYGSGICNHVNSQFCRNARIIPNAIDRYFYDEPSLVNPDKFNVNIDQSK